MEKADHGGRRHVSWTGKSAFCSGEGGVLELLFCLCRNRLRGKFDPLSAGNFVPCRYREEGPGPNVGSRSERARI